MPPQVPSLRPWNLTSRPLQHQNMLHKRTFLQGCIRNRFGSNRLATSPALIRRQQNSGFAILDTVSQALGREASKDDGVYGTDACTGEEGGDSLPGHGEVDRNGVAALDTEIFEDVGDGAYFTEELCV